MRIGFEKGTDKPVDIPLMHTVFCSITRAGKSETVKGLISRSGDTRFLIFDVKRPRDYVGLGVEIPIYVQEKTDPLMLKRLLESQSHLALKFEFPELIKVCKHEDTYKGILEAVNLGLQAKIHPIVENKLLVLQHLLNKLVRELEKTPIQDRLQLENRINVMNLSEVSVELQQLAVYSSLKWILEKGRNLVVVLDEAHRFVPQAGSNASKEAVTTFIKEGGAKGLWLWPVDQTITGVDKQVLKQCWIWILGKQRELNEAKRTLQQIPFKTGLNERDIMRLGVGHFVVCTDQFAKITYVQPSWLPEDVAVKVARGQIPVEEALSFKFKVTEDEEMVYKEKYEAVMEQLREKDQEIKRLERRISLLDKTVEDLSKRKPKEEAPRVPIPPASRGPASPAEKLPIPGAGISESQIIALIDSRLNQRLMDVQDIRVVDVDVEERIKDLVKDNFIAAVMRKIEALPELAKRAGRYVYEKKQVGIGDVYFYLYQKPGRPPGAFYNNAIIPLEDAGLVKRDRKQGVVSWAIDELLLSRFTDFMSKEDIESMREYLISLIL